MKYQLYIKLTSIFLLLAILLCFASCSKNNEDGQKLKYYTINNEDSLCVELIQKYNNYCLKNLDESYQIESISEITEVNLPAICLLNKAKANGYHYALLVDINEKYVSFYEGNFTNMCSVPINEFLCNVSNIFLF